VGVLRSADGLAAAATELGRISDGPAGEVDTEAWETTNVLAISAALAAAAALREETRGSHWREDFPERDDRRMAGHFDVTLAGGRLSLDFRPSPATDPSVPAVDPDERAGALR
jgi:L-aspartate oxidase